MSYSVQISRRALAEIDRALEWLAGRSTTAAARWHQRLMAAVRSLADNPERCSLAPENEWYTGGRLRQLLYGRRRGVYRILFEVRGLQRTAGPDYKALSGRIAQHAQTAFFVTIVSFHEQILGWNAYLARAKDQGGIVRGYERLEGILSDFSLAQVLPFDDDAADIFEDLRRRQIRIGTMDLRIASIALSRNLTILTRNLVDFQQVPNLTAEDWTT